MSKQILSLQNPLIKLILKLQEKSRDRKKMGLCIIEGIREIEMAKQAGYEFESLLFYPEKVSEIKATSFQTGQTEFIEISKEVYQKIAYRESTEGLIAVAKTKTFFIEELQFDTPTPLVLVAEAPEKPGNIGAILRTADAAKLDAVLIANPKTDLYNPNIIRSSVGCLFSNQIATGTSEEIIDFLKEKKIQLYATTLQNSNRYDSEDYTKATAIALGTEATGLSDAFRDAATQNINIPMQGAIDSMNVSVAAAIVIFEAKRQRDFKTSAR